MGSMEATQRFLHAAGKSAAEYALEAKTVPWISSTKVLFASFYSRFWRQGVCVRQILLHI